MLIYRLVGVDEEIKSPCYSRGLRGLTRIISINLAKTNIAEKKGKAADK